MMLSSRSLQRALVLVLLAAMLLLGTALTAASAAPSPAVDEPEPATTPMPTEPATITFGTAWQAPLPPPGGHRLVAEIGTEISAVAISTDAELLGASPTRQGPLHGRFDSEAVEFFVEEVPNRIVTRMLKCLEAPLRPTPTPYPGGLSGAAPAPPTSDVFVYQVSSAENVTALEFMIVLSPAALSSAPLAAKAPQKSSADSTTATEAAGRAGGVIRRWLRRIFVVLGATKWINRRNVLDLDSRRRILSHVEGNPGSHAKQIADALSLRRQTVVYHLRVLEDLGLLASRARSKIHYFSVDQVRSADPRTVLGPTARRVIDELWAGSRTKRELVGTLGITRRGIAWHLRRLAQDGLVRIEQVGRAKHYVPVAASPVATPLLGADVAKNALGVT